MASRTPNGHQPHADPLIVYMKKHKIPVTRKNYFDLNYPDGVPQPWTMELEMQLPKEIRDFRDGNAAHGQR